MPEVRELTTDTEWDRAMPILRQLWSDADPGFVRSWREEEDYRLFGLFLDGTNQHGADSDGTGSEDTDRAADLVGVAGISVQRVLHHRRHAWVHDFVVDEAHRSEGKGRELLRFVEDWAREHDCEYVALANRLGNDRALEFYEDAGLERWGYVVERDLTDG